MKKSVWLRTSATGFVLVTAAIFPPALAQEQTPASSGPAIDHEYTCLMHPEVRTNEPGDCPKCGMPLVAVAAKKSRSAPDAVSHSSRIDVAGRHNTTVPATSYAMPSSISLTDPMSREGSGTSWIPDSSPMYGRMFMLGADAVMLHGAAFPRYVNASTRRGDDRIDVPNWVMAMYSHSFAEESQIGGRLMMSLDPLTEGGRGYPLLFQSGESWNARPLHDRQHPHDLFDEVSISYSRRLIGDLSACVYFGYPGEPALGPPTFMHRPSAMDDPDAPIGHHWQDSGHITFGVATAGVQWKNIKLEGSVFTGREPDENRYDFDKPRFNSYSGRLSWNPVPNLAFQVSHGYLKSPEQLESGLKQHRTTASAIYNVRLGQDGNWATSFVWGQNNTTHEGKSQSLLLETNYQRGANTVYARWERVEKSGHELVLSGPDRDRIFPVAGYSVGCVRDLVHNHGMDLGLGAQFTINDMPDRLQNYYGSDLPYSFQFFVRIRPSHHDMTGHEP